MSKYQIGDKLWYVPSSERYSPCEVEITAIGRKWIYFGRSRRADIATLQVDGGEYSSLGTLFESESHYHEELKLNDSWRLFRDLVDRSRICPVEMTVEKIYQMTKMIKE